MSIDDKVKEIVNKSSQNFIEDMANDKTEITIETFYDISSLSPRMRFKELKYFMDQNGVDRFSKKTLLTYIESGLLISPEKEHSNQAIYNEEHVYGYLLIDALKDFVPLVRIQQLFKICRPLINYEGYKGLFEGFLVATKNENFTANLAKDILASLPDYKDAGIYDSETDDMYVSIISFSFVAYAIALLSNFDKPKTEYLKNVKNEEEC